MYRSTIAQYRLIIHGKTEHISYKGDFLIFHFDFRRFTTLIDVEKLDESILFDVIGMVVEINPIQMKSVKRVQTRMIAFSLMDPEGNIMPCTLWGTYVDQFLNFESQLAHNGNPWTLIILLWRSRSWAGDHAGDKVLIPRMIITPSNVRIPFKFQRRQRQSLSHVGLYLKKPVFSHGQLYVVVSRVTNRKEPSGIPGQVRLEHLKPSELPDCPDWFD
ncbi:replication protein A 70 kDa DNA-binding subunit [Striga asiatica]|uniref:Replication protein A 70 kDa DNA-binding subunit n=1 Tax=Striga asiatica TaxID=4170 RepID=A0A5A7PEG5_STRAF|nr:replication protein A 70 kDa DNA-binding subunit [Striga asiatica]